MYLENYEKGLCVRNSQDIRHFSQPGAEDQLLVLLRTRRSGIRISPGEYCLRDRSEVANAHYPSIALPSSKLAWGSSEFTFKGSRQMAVTAETGFQGDSRDFSWCIAE